MAVAPGINLPFHRMAGVIDPRQTASRASVATGVNRFGQIFTVPAGVMRPRWNPMTGIGEGIEMERQATNLLLRSQEFDNVAWTATQATLGANAVVAPDATTTADSITATGAGCSLAQAFTITAGRGIAISIWARAFSTNFLNTRIADGTVTLDRVWDLTNGTIPGAAQSGAGTITISRIVAEQWPGGWWRLMFTVTTATSTAFTFSLWPASTSSGTPANGNSAYLWGAQAEAEQTDSTVTSYIVTAGTTVQRQADMLQLPVSPAWFNPNEGTMVFEFINRHNSPTSPGSNVFGGLANTFSDVFYLARVGTTTMRMQCNNTAGNNAALDRTWDFQTLGLRQKVAFSWSANNLQMVVNGGAAASFTGTFSIPQNFARFGMGCAPWTTNDNGNKPHATVHAFKYIPRQEVAADLQVLTAA
jgi:hypothetical protein